MKKIKYCCCCGEQIKESKRNNNFVYCANCRTINNINLKIACCTIPQKNEKIILTKRSVEPQKGKWSLTGGLMEKNEKPEETAIRETFEEIGLTVDIQKLIGVYYDHDPLGMNSMVIVYKAKITGGQLKVSPEVQSVNFFDMSEIPWKELAFNSTKAALDDLFNYSPEGRVKIKKKSQKIQATGKDSVIHKGIICLDFDGVIADISSGYKGIGVFGDPLPDARSALIEIRKRGWAIIVYTSRDEISQVRSYLNKHKLPFNAINRSLFDSRETIRGKPLADIYIDDKAIKFNGDWNETLDQIFNLR